MSLLNALKLVKEEGFDPKKDKLNKSGKLENGTYPVRLKSAQADVNKFERVQIAFTFEVASGDFKNRLETIYLSFDEDLHEFILEKNGKTLLKLAYVCDIELTGKDAEDEYAMAQAFEKAIGKQFQMDLKISPNKKNPDYPYRNYEFNKLKSDSQDFDVPEEDFPF